MSGTGGSTGPPVMKTAQLRTQIDAKRAHAARQVWLRMHLEKDHPAYQIPLEPTGHWPRQNDHAVKTADVESPRRSNGKQRKKDQVDQDRTDTNAANRGSILEASCPASLLV